MAYSKHKVSKTKKRNEKKYSRTKKNIKVSRKSPKNATGGSLFKRIKKFGQKHSPFSRRGNAKLNQLTNNEYRQFSNQKEANNRNIRLSKENDDMLRRLMMEGQSRNTIKKNILLHGNANINNVLDNYNYDTNNAYHNQNSEPWNEGDESNNNTTTNTTNTNTNTTSMTTMNNVVNTELVSKLDDVKNKLSELNILQYDDILYDMKNNVDKYSTDELYNWIDGMLMYIEEENDFRRQQNQATNESSTDVQNNNTTVMQSSPPLPPILIHEPHNSNTNSGANSTKSKGSFLNQIARGKQLRHVGNNNSSGYTSNTSTKSKGSFLNNIVRGTPKLRHVTRKNNKHNGRLNNQNTNTTPTKPNLGAMGNAMSKMLNTKGIPSGNGNGNGNGSGNGNSSSENNGWGNENETNA